MAGDIDEEIQKLTLKKMELTNKLNVSDDFDEKEGIRSDIQRLQHQIETLEKFKKKF